LRADPEVSPSTNGAGTDATEVDEAESAPRA
jgi:hypothetical protein